MKTEKVKKQIMKTQFTKVPTYFINNYNEFSKVEFGIILFILNFNFEGGIATNKLYQKLGIQQSNFSRAMKSLIEKGVMKKINGDYILILPEEKEVPTDDEILSSEEPKVENDIPTEVEEIIETAVENEPKIEQMETSTENCFVDENGKKYSIADIRGLLDVTFIEDIPNYRTILFQYGVPYFFQEYGKDYFFPEELPTFYNMVLWYMKNY